MEFGEVDICFMDNVYSMSTYFVLSTAFKVGVRAQNSRAENPCWMGAYILEGDADMSQWVITVEPYPG